MPHSPLLIALLLAAGSPSGEEEPMVAIQVEILDAEQNPIASSHHLSAIGSAVNIEHPFTLRPLHKREFTLTLEITATEAAADSCTLAVRSRITDAAPELMLVGPAEETRVGGVEFSSILDSAMVDVRVRCLPLDELLLPAG